MSQWFHDRYGRAPGEDELTTIINAMADRAAPPPHDGPNAERPNAERRGWATPAAPPTARR